MLEDYRFNIPGFNFIFPSFPPTFDLLRVSSSKISQFNLVAKFLREQLFFLRTFILIEITLDALDHLCSVALVTITARCKYSMLNSPAVDTLHVRTIKNNSVSQGIK